MIAGSQREPRFLWTGLLILLPVLGLGAVGVWQLRQDRAAALAEARADAKKTLEEALGQWRIDLPHAVAITHWLVFARDGTELLTPKPIPPVPVPIAEPPPEAEALIAILDDATLAPAEKAEALHAFCVGLNNEGDLYTSAGLPVKQIALRSALRFGKEAEIEPIQLNYWAIDLAREAVYRPSVLTERLVADASEFVLQPTDSKMWPIVLWQWEISQRARQFYGQSRNEIADLVTAAVRAEPAIASSWIGTTEKFYCQAERTAEGIFVRAHPLEAIRKFAADLTGKVSLPEHLGIRLWLDGQIVFGQVEAELVAMAEDPSEKIRAEIVFADRDAFFQPVTERSRRTALLIALAVFAAGVGWIVAWRAFARQKQLAAMKDNFVSAVSHELRAPIASIGLMAEELGSGSEKRTEYTELIAGECSRLGSLVENVLDYARLESGSETFEFEEADLGDLVRATAELMRPPALERGMTIAVDAPAAGELCAQVDARALGRALVNLVDNAIKYAPAGTEISVRASGNRITVADQGDPIPAGDRERIFERFVRSGSELTRESKGVGIGLSLVRHIARAHGGDVDLESDEKGNRFSISFKSRRGDA